MRPKEQTKPKRSSHLTVATFMSDLQINYAYDKPPSIICTVSYIR